MIYLVFVLGRAFHQNGYWYIYDLFSQDEAFTERVNNLLLTLYYLMNGGFVFVSIHSWEPVYDLASMIASLSSRIGIILLVIALMHYVNIFTLIIIKKSKLIFHL
jgi:hypothetical protein